jgi:hypothetical protein
VNKLVSVAMATIIMAAPVAAAPAASAAATSVQTVSVQTRTVNYPQAVPGRFCKAAYKGAYTKTKRYGQLKCTYKGGHLRWVR